MKFGLITGAMMMALSFTASAHVPVEHMTCAQAQAFSLKNGMYWKDAGPDGQIPMYPTKTFKKVNCTGRTTPRQQMERTLDVKQCVVSWYCLPY